MKQIWYIVALLSGIMWGACGVFVRILMAAGFDNLTIIFLRVVISAFFLLVILFFYDRSLLRIQLCDIWIFVCAGVIGSTCLNFCYNIAIASLNISFAAVLLALAPVFVLAASSVLFGEKLTRKKMFSSALAIVGCVLVSGLLENLSSQNLVPFGIMAGLGSALFYAAYIVFSKIGMEHGYHALTITFYNLLFSSIALLFYTDFQLIGTFVVQSPVESSALLIGHAFCCALLPNLLYNLALSHAEPGKSAVFAAAGEPSSAMLFGLVFFAETPTWSSVIGLLVVVVSLAILLSSGSEDIGKGETPSAIDID